MSPPPPSLVWFLLLDSATGLPYKGTCASNVSVNALADLDDFRNAVKTKHSNKLSSVDAADLLVYKNQSAFEKRNAAVDDGKKEPMDPTESLDLLGSKEDMLVVVVPSSRCFSPARRFFTCSRSFYNNIRKATETDGWVNFEEEIPLTTLTKVFVRDSYREVATAIKPGLNKSVILGTPGIGKSLFLIYLLWKRVSEKKRVLFVYGPDTIYFDGTGGVYEVVKLPSVVDHMFWSDTLWCLFDARFKKEDHLCEIPCSRCTVVVSTSPRRDLLNDFKKPPTPEYFFLPLWDKSEMQTISGAFPVAVNWVNHFEILGGIPRFVLESPTKEPIELLQAACKECDIDDCIKIIRFEPTITEMTKATHSLVHINSVSPYKEPSVSFASKTALDIIVNDKWRIVKQRMDELLESCSENQLAATLGSYIFEKYTLQVLEKGGHFDSHELVRGNQNEIPKESRLFVPPSTRVIADKVLPEQLKLQLYVPRVSNSEAIDAWMPGFGVFLITSAENRKLSAAVRTDLSSLSEGCGKIFWLLPPHLYHSHEKKHMHDIPQFAVRIPYPENLKRTYWSTA